MKKLFCLLGLNMFIALNAMELGTPMPTSWLSFAQAPSQEILKTHLLVAVRESSDSGFPFVLGEIDSISEKEVRIVVDSHQREHMIFFDENIMSGNLKIFANPEKQPPLIGNKVPESICTKLDYSPIEKSDEQCMAAILSLRENVWYYGKICEVCDDGYALVQLNALLDEPLKKVSLIAIRKIDPSLLRDDL